MSACGAHTLAHDSTGSSGSATDPPPCVVPGGHAHAVAGDAAGVEAWLQVTFLQPCDLSVRVSGVNLMFSYSGPTDVAAVRILFASGHPSAPVTLYDSGVDGPRARPLQKTFRSFQASVSLDQFRAAVCGAQARFEVVFAAEPRIEVPVIPSNTGKC